MRNISWCPCLNTRLNFYPRINHAAQFTVPGPGAKVETICLQPAGCWWLVAGGDVYIYRTAQLMGKCCLRDSLVSRVTPPRHSPPAEHPALISSLVSCLVAISTGIQMCFYVTTLPAWRVDCRECGKKR